MFRYKLRTLMIALAVLPPAMAASYWAGAYWALAQMASDTLTCRQPSPYRFVVIDVGAIEPATSLELRSAVKAAYTRAKDDSDSGTQ